MAPDMGWVAITKRDSVGAVLMVAAVKVVVAVVSVAVVGDTNVKAVVIHDIGPLADFGIVDSFLGNVQTTTRACPTRRTEANKKVVYQFGRQEKTEKQRQEEMERQRDEYKQKLLVDLGVIQMKPQGHLNDLSRIILEN
uniref:Uncharacterized protein n=1 Tax=Romanomermis culicivorax TaxID=13658 RepID=A0A915I7N7_ROMCU